MTNLGHCTARWKALFQIQMAAQDALRDEEIHNAFADRKLNFVNQRREFFRVSLDEIKKVVKENYDRSVEFVELAPAEQYRESIKLREEAQKAKQSAQG